MPSPGKATDAVSAPKLPRAALKVTLRSLPPRPSIAVSAPPVRGQLLADNRQSTLDEPEATVLASSKERPAFPPVAVPLEHVDESSKWAAIAQLVSDDIEACVKGP